MSLSPLMGRGFYDLQSEMNRMFDEAFGGLSQLMGSRPRSRASAGWTPALDVLRRDGDVVIRAELPGVKLEDVDITVHEGVLTISGERREEGGGGGYFVRERRYGAFSRSVALPAGVDEEKIHARYEDGVLEVIVEGAAAVIEPRRIQIQGPGGRGA